MRPYPSRVLQVELQVSWRLAPLRQPIERLHVALACQKQWRLYFGDFLNFNQFLFRPGECLFEVREVGTRMLEPVWLLDATLPEPAVLGEGDCASVGR